MANGLKLKVNKETYKEALSKLDDRLRDLDGCKTSLNEQINNLNDETFAGSDVESALKKAKEALEAVDSGIMQVQGYKEAIQSLLDSATQTSETLSKAVESINIPNMFE